MPICPYFPSFLGNSQPFRDPQPPPINLPSTKPNNFKECFFFVSFFWGDVILIFWFVESALFPIAGIRLTWTQPWMQKTPRAALFGPQTDIHKPLAFRADRHLQAAGLTFLEPPRWKGRKYRGQPVDGAGFFWYLFFGNSHDGSMGLVDLPTWMVDVYWNKIW